MWYVYILRSKTHSRAAYIGLTQDLRKRIADHNAGRSPSTKKLKPWCLTLYLAFADKSKAERFEKYLKTGAGRAFANKHLL